MPSAGAELGDCEDMNFGSWRGGTGRSQVLPDPGAELADDGETLAVVSLTPPQVRPVGRHEIAQARSVAMG